MAGGAAGRAPLVQSVKGPPNPVYCPGYTHTHVRTNARRNPRTHTYKTMSYEHKRHTVTYIHTSTHTHNLKLSEHTKKLAQCIIRVHKVHIRTCRVEPFP